MLQILKHIDLNQEYTHIRQKFYGFNRIFLCVSLTFSVLTKIKNYTFLND